MGQPQRVRLLAQHDGGAGERVGRQNPGEQVVERCAQRVEVAARVSAGALKLFEGRILKRVAEDAARDDGLRLAARPFR